MTMMQAMLLGAGGAVATKTYVDDIFNTYLFKGNSSTQTITNGIDLSGEGGLVWSKTRDVGDNHRLTDTVRGVNKSLCSDLTSAEYTTSGLQGVSQFNSNGFVSGLSDSFYNDDDISSWTFRKAKGFFDIVTYTGNGSNRTIAHSLSSIPGMIIIKNVDDSDEWWAVYHRQLNGGTNPEQYYLRLNDNNAEASSADLWNNTAPTSTNFSLGTGNAVNKNGDDYIAYVFAGGESTAATANSVKLDGTGDVNTTDYFMTDTSSNYTPGTSDFTLEYWFNQDSNDTQALVESDVTNQWGTYTTAAGLHKYRTLDTDRLTSKSTLALGQWHHVAIVRSSGTTRMYINGIQEGGTYADSTDFTFDQIIIGLRLDGSYDFGGKISNVRFVVGTAVYTSSFRPPTEPLTNITNTKLLCCNTAASAWSGSNTNATVGTVTAYGSQSTNGGTASSDSPFDDPAGFVLGDAGDQNVIKCGTYTTDSNEDATINLGWEPQWVLAKRTDGNYGPDWMIVDSMRGFPNAQNVQQNNSGECNVLEANTGDAENNTSRLGLTSTGFFADQFGSNRTFIYVAIRRPDGYVGKPVEVATDVFTMSTGNSSASIPAFTSGFPVDFAIQRRPATAQSWILGTRLTGKYYVKTDSNDSQTIFTSMLFDSNTGWLEGSSYTSDWQSWMWKRHAGFDVVTYEGNNTSNTQISHSLNAVPQMIWIKQRDNSKHWVVGHFGINGGTNPWDYYLELNTDDVQDDDVTCWQDTTPTSTHFTLGHFDAVNNSLADFVALLFTSVSGISKVGYYDGSDSSQTITTGFQPRFLIIKCSSDTADWQVIDTIRGWGSGNDQRLWLNSTSQQSLSPVDVGQPTSTGFTLTGDDARWNDAGKKYIYYAHA